MPLSEDEIQARVRVIARQHGAMLYRNNTGVAREVNESGRTRMVRYGLCNDNPELNKKYKSADLIGWRTIIITPEMVGLPFALFTSRECKGEGWRFSGTEREVAQLNWANLVNEAGGDACFVATPDGFVNPHFNLRHHAR